MSLKTNGWTRAILILAHCRYICASGLAGRIKKRNGPQSLLTPGRKLYATILSLWCHQMQSYTMQHWKQTQSEHTPCRTTTPHASKSPLVTSRVHCNLTDKRGMQHTRGSHTLRPLTECFCPIPIITHPKDVLLGGDRGRHNREKRGRTAAMSAWVSSFWSTEGAVGPGDLTARWQPAASRGR